MSEPLILEFEFTESDYAEFLAFHSRRSPMVGNARGPMRWLPPILWLAILSYQGLYPYEIAMWVAFTVVWVGLLPRYYAWNMRRNSLMVARQGINRGFFGPHRLQVDPAGVVIATRYAETRNFWPGVQDVVVTPTQVLFYLGTHAALIVPKRAFAGDAALGSFIDRVNELRRAAA